ncbi:MAG TPA: type II secretion system F family protein [Candidatus Poseidoniales archaeon]|nr:MAG TPA: type II secretion system F family protein [Candidatus Poseidoniales archaeon]HII32073.1 type II secretion system F family protein [Candidatus Poseidoniaceae archaeon]
MARKKKNKIVVNLDLPKDDSTMTKLYGILFVSILLGMSTAVVWVTNSGFIPTSNGEPMFTNVACGIITGDNEAFNGNSKPTYAQNESCSLLQDSPDVVSWNDEPWEDIILTGKNFDVPGVDPLATGGEVVVQPLTLTCEAEASGPVSYTVAIRDRYGDIVSPSFTGNTGLTTDECLIEIESIDPGTRYELVVQSNTENEPLDQFTFTMEIEYYDGIPANMNNKSLWIGPEVSIGPLGIHPTIFLNFFGLMFFFFLWPASFYWERVENKKNEIEEKFPDFLRDLAEYWKGGLSMTVAVQTLATSEYGALNDEVKKMSDQLSWGIKFSDVILQFAERVGTPLVKRAISLISEADRAGGKISDILVTAANDSREIKFLEGERKRAIGSYIAVIWTSYFVFLGVIVVLSTVFIPAIANSNSSDDGGGGQNIGNMKIRNVDPLFFLTIFYYGVTMQAIGNGCMAGLMATGRFSAGFKHSGMMILVALVVFNVIAFSPNLIGITAPPGVNPSVGTFMPAPLNLGG